MSAFIRPRSQPAGAPRLAEWRWVCRDHDRLRVGHWGARGSAINGQLIHNATEHPHPVGASLPDLNREAE